MKKPAITFRIEPDGMPITVIGRDSWLLAELLRVGGRGLTTMMLPAGVRVSHSVYKLRRAGLIIETIDERHDGPFAGNHARYVLRSAVTVLSDAPAMGDAA